MYPDDLTTLAWNGQFVGLVRFPGYGVTTDGRVWSFKRDRWLKTYVMANGKNKWYVSFGARSYFLHKIILEAFRGPCPDGMIGCHNDDDPSNNHIDNLRWDTPQSNVDDRVQRDAYAKGSLHHKAKLTEDDVRKIRAMRAAGGQVVKLAAEFGIDFTTISDICRRKTWRHLE